MSRRRQKKLDDKHFPFLVKDKGDGKGKRRVSTDEFLSSLDDIFSDPKKLDHVFSEWVNDTYMMDFDSWRRPTLEELLNLSDFPLDYKFPETVEVKINQTIKALEKGLKPKDKLRTKKISFWDQWNMIGNIVLPKQMEEIAKHIKDELGWT